MLVGLGEAALHLLGGRAEAALGVLAGRRDQALALAGGVVDEAGGLFGALADHPLGLLRRFADHPLGLLGRFVDQPLGFFGRFADHLLGFLGRFADEPLGFRLAFPDPQFRGLGALALALLRCCDAFPLPIVGGLGAFPLALLRCRDAFPFPLVGGFSGFPGELLGFRGRVVDQPVRLVGGFADAAVRLVGAFPQPPVGLFGRLPDPTLGLGLAGRLLLGEGAHGFAAARGHRDLEVLFHLGPAGLGLLVGAPAVRLCLAADPLGFAPGLVHQRAVFGLHLAAPGVGLGDQPLVAGPQVGRLGFGARADLARVFLGTSPNVVGLVLGESQHPLQALAESFQRGRRLGEPFDLTAQALDLGTGRLQLLGQVTCLGDRRIPIRAEDTDVGVESL